MMANLTSTSDFLLLGFSDIQEVQILYFFMFFTIYLTAVTGNLLIILAVSLDQNLHTPMYFFLMNLAVLDLGTVSVMVPKAMAISLMNSRSVSYSGCIAQVFFLFFLGGSDFAILTVMAHDRYVAICNPLQYETIMHRGACIQMAVSAWIAGILNGMLHTGGTFAITFCSNEIDQFFCEVPQMLKLACSGMYLVEVGMLVFSWLLGMGCFIFIIVTYVHIFVAVLRIPSARGQKKAISTCLPHLTVVSLLIFSGIFAYVRPRSHSSSNLNVLFAIIYAIVPPMLNPFIYSMRNKEIKNALLKLGHFSKIIMSKESQRGVVVKSQCDVVVKGGGL